jgi:alpha-galactosidase
MYKGRKEFLYLSYQRLMKFFDELNDRFPELIIDCTYELWGDHHSIDYSLIKHAHVDWISNFYSNPPKGARNVRKLCYHRGTVIPTNTMMIGNQKIDVKNHEFSFYSNLGTTPIMLGDPRNLMPEEQAWYKKNISWLQKMEEKFNISRYYQVGEVFPPAAAGNWDGFARINTNMNAGIFCIFRNNSPEKSRRFKIPWIDPQKKYQIKTTSNKNYGKYSGKELINKGVEVSVNSKHSAEIFSIQPVRE